MMTKLFEGQTVIDAETSLPMTAARKAEIRNMLLVEGMKVEVAPECEEAFRAEGLSIELVQAEIWADLGGKTS